MDKKKTDDEVLQVLLDSLDADVLIDAVPEAEVDAELRAAGGDPAAIVRRGRAAIDQLLERRRLAWQETARKRVAQQRALISGRAPREKRSHPELIAEINRVRADPAMGGMAAMAFHKRKPEEASVEELEEMLDEFELLKKMRTDGSPKDK